VCSIPYETQATMHGTGKAGLDREPESPQRLRDRRCYGAPRVGEVALRIRGGRWRCLRRRYSGFIRCANVPDSMVNHVGESGESREQVLRPRSGLAPRLRPSPPKNRRPRLNGLPIEEMMTAGPGVDLGGTDAASETAGMLVRVLLSRRGVIHPATGAGELFGGPDAVGHEAATCA
jgi:hypothetical protein